MKKNETDKAFGKAGTRALDKGTNINPKLRSRLSGDGEAESLFLLYYMGYNTDEKGKAVPFFRKESLHLTLFTHPRNSEERDHNRKTLQLARKIQYERGQQFLENKTGYRLEKDKKVDDFLAFYREYMDNYTKSDLRNIRMGYTKFIAFLKDTKGLEQYADGIRPELITPEMIRHFVDYLQKVCRGDGPQTHYGRFKKVMKYATAHEVFKRNPCEGISIRCDNGQLKKEILSPEEIQKMLATHYSHESQVVRDAFTFCLYTGIRWCDVRDLTYEDVDAANRILRFDQNKTKGHSSASQVIIPLNDDLLRLIGEPENPQYRKELVFPLPSYESALKSIKYWAAQAGITKKISWHCARHSFAVNILNNGANIKTVSSLLGHASLKHTEKYTRAIDSLKRDAIDSLAPIFPGETQGEG